MNAPNEDSFRQEIFRLLSEGQDLSNGEKMLVNQTLNKFTKNFKQATGENPMWNFGTIYLIAPILEDFGFKLPEVDRWRKEDIQTINNYVERAGIKNFGKEKF